IPERATIGWFMPVEQQERQVIARGPTSVDASTPLTASHGADRAGAPRARPNASMSAAVTPRDADPSPFAKRASRRLLKNGMTLVVVENHAVPTVALQATILAGTVAVPVGKPALALLTADMLDRGTNTKGKLAIAEALDVVGAQLDVNGGFLGTTAAGTGLSRAPPLPLHT